MAVIIDTEKCDGCGDCVDTCPMEVLEIGPEGKVILTDADGCSDCGSCTDECEFDALSV